MDPTLPVVKIDFTFGTYYSVGLWWQHAQLTLANNYQYNFIDEYNKTKNNGTKLIINAYGSTGANSANWELKHYKF